MKFFATYFFLLVLSGCSSALNLETKILNFGDFEMTVPKNWKKINLKGIDSQVGAVKLDKNEKIFYDYGYYSNKLKDLEKDNSVEFKIIDGKKAKIIHGYYTGIYFDSIKFIKSDSMNMKLQFSTKNLSKINQKKILTAFETLKFKE